MPSLYKEGGSRVGDSGAMSLQVWVDEDGKLKSAPGRPVVGRAIRVGSPFARSYSNQDWWQTSEIVEILDDKPTRVRFKTRSGSTYVWRP